MKRAISIFFIALAGVIILVHAVVPHHHHNKVFAAIVNVLDSDYQEKLHHSHDLDSHHPDSATHHHDPGNPEECLITESSVTPVRIGDNCSHIVPDLQAVDFHLESACFVADLFAADVADASVDYECPPYLNDIHLRHYISSAGFRAPPAC